MATSSVFTPTVLTVASAATSGSGEINAILNPSAATDTTGWAVTGTATVTRIPSGGPLDPVIATGLTLASGAASEYVKYDFVLPASLKNTELKIEWSQAAPTSGEWKVELRTQAGVAYALTTDSSGVSAIPAAAGKFTTTFTTDNVQTLSLRFVRVTGSNSLVISNVIVGPGIQLVNPGVSSGLVSASGLPGRTNGQAVAAGYVGQKIQSAFTSLTAAATTVIQQAATVSLTPGVWMLVGVGCLSRNNATLSDDCGVIISTTSASNAGATIGNEQVQCSAPIAATASSTATTAPVIVSLSTTTNYYLNVYAYYTAGSPRWHGSLTAVRIA